MWWKKSGLLLERGDAPVNHFSSLFHRKTSEKKWTGAFFGHLSFAAAMRLTRKHEGASCEGGAFYALIKKDRGAAPDPGPLSIRRERASAPSASGRS